MLAHVSDHPDTPQTEGPPCSVQLTCEGGIFECQRVGLLEELERVKAERDEAVEQMNLWYKANKPLCDIIKERDQLKAEVERLTHDFCKMSDHEHTAVMQRDALRSLACELARALVEATDGKTRLVVIPWHTRALELVTKARAAGVLE